jgi:hypothetical protein
MLWQNQAQRTLIQEPYATHTAQGK